MNSKLQKRYRLDYIFKIVTKLVTYSTVIILAILLTHIVKQGVHFLKIDIFTNFPSRFAHKAGLKAGIFGSIWLMSITAIISVPIAILSAIFLEEYGLKGRIGKFIEVNIANLAGVPSIVYGLLGLAVFVRYWSLERSILAGALTLSLLILPIIIIASREAVRAVPNSIRYAAYALGAQKWHVVFFQVLPVALPGILTGVILALSRAIGETAPLIIIGALSYISYIPESVMDEFSVLPIQIYNWASRPKAEFHQLAASGIIILLAVMLSMNLLAVIIRYKTSKRRAS